MDLTQNYFELFGLPVSPDIDEADLATRWQVLQRECHPDRHAAGSSVEQRYAMQMASQINEAYKTLREPLSRAVYLLQLSGVDLGAETDTRMDPAFLMQQMAFRESIDELREAAGREDAGTQNQLDDLHEEVADQQAAIASQFNEAWKAKELASARGLARQWQFTHKLLSELRELENDSVL